MRLNKGQMEVRAQDLARKNEIVLAQTIEQIEAMTWEQRRTLARELAYKAASPMIGGGQWADRYEDAFIEAFISEASSVWHRKVQDLEDRRKAFKRACRGLTLEAASARVKALIESFNLRGRVEISDGFGVSVRVSRGWGVEADLYVRFERERDGNKVINPDDTTQCAGHYAVETKLSWSATSRTVSSALAATKLYTELIEVAAEVEVTMREEPIVWTYGVPEPTPVVEPEPVAEA